MQDSGNSGLYGWHLQLGRVEYKRVLEWQRGLVKLRAEGFARDTIITVEHPPVVTVGKDGHSENFKNLDCEPIAVERGGDVTYHGPGQLVVYFIFNLTRRERNLHRFMANIQGGIIETLQKYGISARRDDEHTGVWVKDKKIASVGVAVKKWISFHGAALNLNTCLSDFTAIQPCGLDATTMTSAAEILGKEVDLHECSDQLVRSYCDIFETTFSPVDLESLAEDVESQSGGYEI